MKLQQQIEAIERQQEELRIKLENDNLKEQQRVKRNDKLKAQLEAYNAKKYKED